MGKFINSTSRVFGIKGWAGNEEVIKGERREKTVVTGCHPPEGKNLQFWSRRVTFRCYIFLNIILILIL